MFRDFPKVSKEDWLKKVEEDLKGKPLAGLNWEINGKAYTPFYHSEDVKNEMPALAGVKKDNSWEIGNRIVVDDYRSANRQALESLEKGANALCFEFLNPLTFDDFCELSEGIHFDWICTYFIFPKKGVEEFLTNFNQVLESNKQDPQSINCSFQFTDFSFSNLKRWQTVFPKAHFLTINSILPFKDSKGVVDELAWILHEGNKILIAMNEQGLDVSTLYSSIQFSIALGNDYFQNIAKIRTLKLLWCQILNAWDNALIVHPFINVFLTDSTQTSDEHYNKIIAATQAMSAVIGGANRLFVYPSDSFNTVHATSFSQRIALNLQHILQQESYLDKVIDPSAGSYFIEYLTDSLAEQTWALFQKQTY
jgi:methylmalonyl-CoA mutase